MGMPVTTPKTKLMPKMRPQNARRDPTRTPGAQSDRLQHHDQQRQSHGELRKEIVEGDGKGEVQPMDKFCRHDSVLKLQV